MAGCCTLPCSLCLMYEYLKDLINEAHLRLPSTEHVYGPICRSNFALRERETIRTPTELSRCVSVCICVVSFTLSYSHVLYIINRQQLSIHYDYFLSSIINSKLALNMPQLNRYLNSLATSHCNIYLVRSKQIITFSGAGRLYYYCAAVLWHR